MDFSTKMMIIISGKYSCTKVQSPSDIRTKYEWKIQLTRHQNVMLKVHSTKIHRQLTTKQKLLVKS